MAWNSIETVVYRKLCELVSEMASAGAGGHSTVLPAASRALQRKWEERKLHEHKERVRTDSALARTSTLQPRPLSMQLRKIKSSVDNGPPKNFIHLKQNLRKRQVRQNCSQYMFYTILKYRLLYRSRRIDGGRSTGITASC